jgi:N-acyl-phosphatidylethanolamine-hydrolysing phospholipase D
MHDDRSHHGPDGRFRNPWPLGPQAPPGGVAGLRWAWERFRNGVPPDPAPGDIPRAVPDPAMPRLPAGADEVRITWIGHASFLVQLPGFNLLTDPVLSERASPVQWAGPRRFTAPGLDVDGLPPVDAVLLSHDHYDHLDAPTVEALRDRDGAAAGAATWFAPLGYRRWFARRGVEQVVELDWWQDAALEPPGRLAAGPVAARGGGLVGAGAGASVGAGAGASVGASAAAGAGDGPVRIVALPARHWTRRRLGDTRRRLWCSWAVATPTRRIYFGGDSGYGPAFAEIGDRVGPFDLAILPIGAYEPRWFMASSHVTPEEAARAALDVRADAMVAGHWGTFRLTDEDPLEPPVRMTRAWADLGQPASRLFIPAIGETLRL